MTRPTSTPQCTMYTWSKIFAFYLPYFARKYCVRAIRRLGFVLPFGQQLSSHAITCDYDDHRLFYYLHRNQNKLLLLLSDMITIETQTKWVKNKSWHNMYNCTYVRSCALDTVMAFASEKHMLDILHFNYEEYTNVECTWPVWRGEMNTKLKWFKMYRNKLKRFE